jgi:uncharacterized protein YcbK (DUF882 family)
MGDLSEHFNHKDFVCRCDACKGKEYKIHLGLVGILEQVWEHFQRSIKVIQGFRCEAENEKEGKPQKSFHLLGKAVHIIVENVAPATLIEYLRTLPDVHGIGFNVDDGSVHVDARREERVEWVREGKSRYVPMSEDKKRQYGL